MSQNFIKRLLGKRTKAQSTSVTQASDDDYLIHFSDFTHDAQGRVRMSEMNTIFDGKVLNQDNPDLWHNVGTGTYSFSNSISTLSVTNGQYLVRQTNRYLPYYSGKSQLLEFTMDKFHLEVGKEKGFGPLSSSSTAPYNTVYDGYAIVNTGSTYQLNIYNNGTTVASIDWTNWDGYSKISSYDFSKFTVFATDYLWLGGAILRLFLKLPGQGFVLIHTYTHAGINAGIMFKSPNLPLRYWIRSTTGSGSFSPICCQAASEGSVDERGNQFSYYNSTAINCNAIGTIYAVRSFKKQISFRDMVSEFMDISLINNGTTDTGIGMLLKNPTVSSAISYTNSDYLQIGTPTTQTITTGTGKVVCSFPVGVNGNTYTFPKTNNIFLQNRIDDVVAEYVIAYMPLSANQALSTTCNILVM